MSESSKRVILVIAMAVSTAPIGLIVPLPAAGAALKAWALYGSAVTGYIGIVMLLWMYILGTRATSAIIFNDIAPVLSIHSRLGKYGSIAILLHPLLIIYGYGESILYSIIPQLGTEFERHVTLGRLSFVLVVVIWVTSALIRGRIRYRPWKYIHYLAYISLPFALLHVPDVGSLFMSQQAVKVYYYTIVVGFIIFTLLRIRSLLNLDRLTYQLVRQSRLDATTYSLILKPKDGAWLTPNRGQYVQIKLGLVSEDHPFSVVQYDKDTHELQIAYRIFGTYTESLSHMQPGSIVKVSGPYGNFMHEINETTNPIVFIAGGIGITPFIDHIIRGDASRERWLFFASSTRKRAAYLDVLQDELGDHCIPIISQDPTIPVHLRHINADIITSHLPARADQYIYFICGPVGMIKATRTILTSLGVPLANIHSEAFAF